METIYDWVTMAVFAGLIVLFLQRSSEAVQRDSLWQYLVAAVGCAVCNYLGNEGYTIFAVLVLVGVLAFVYYVLRPFESNKS
ncbi:MAG: XrtV sorting system accessory protein [Pseudomonadota bacterium]|jgi:hypothetical protein